MSVNPSGKRKAKSCLWLLIPNLGRKVFERSRKKSIQKHIIMAWTRCMIVLISYKWLTLTSFREVISVLNWAGCELNYASVLLFWFLYKIDHSGLLFWTNLYPRIKLWQVYKTLINYTICTVICFVVKINDFFSQHCSKC